MERIDSSRIDVASLDLRDAVDLAIAVEGEASDRYRLFARMVGGRYRGDADEVFRAMAMLEEQHRASLAGRRRRLFGAAPRRLDPAGLDDVQAPDPGAIRVFMGPRDAIRVALEAETRAVDFYDEAAQLVRDPDARAFFEELRDEEADHCRALDAWQLEVAAGPDVEDDDADPPGSDAG